PGAAQFQLGASGGEKNGRVDLELWPARRRPVHGPCKGIDALTKRVGGDGTAFSFDHLEDDRGPTLGQTLDELGLKAVMICVVVSLAERDVATGREPLEQLGPRDSAPF